MNAPESSVRKYREIFDQFIPSIGTGRSKRYRMEAIDILREIRYLREEMLMPWDAIADQLASKYPIDATPSEPVDTEIQEFSEHKHIVPDDTPQQPAPSIPQSDSEPVPPKTPAPASDANPPSPQIIQAPPSHEPQTHVTPRPRQAAPDAKDTETTFRKLASMFERQTMMMNAIATELSRSVEKVREESRADNRRLQTNFAMTLDAMMKSVEQSSAADRKFLADIRARLARMETILAEFPDNANAAAQLAESEAAMKILKTEMGYQIHSLKMQLAEKEATGLYGTERIGDRDAKSEKKDIRSKSPIIRFLTKKV